MKSENVQKGSGIDCINDLSWGTHLCNVYNNLNDLFDVLVPYCETGIASNECCVWVIPKSISKEEAQGMLAKRMQNLAECIIKGQFETLSYDEIYVIDGVFNEHKVVRAWLNIYERARARGFDGLRVAGSTDWIESKDWKQFIDYEKQIDNAIENHKIIAICNYSLLDSSPSQFADAVLTHQFCVINKEGETAVVAHGNNIGMIKELKKRIWELEVFNKFCMNREERIIELKNEVEALKNKLKDNHQ